MSVQPDIEQFQTTWPMPAVAPSADEAPARGMVLTVCGGPNQGAVFRIGGSRIVIGRTAGVDMRLADPAVSQFHAELKLGPSGLSVRDLGSRNGIWCNGLRIENAHIPSGSVLSLGQSLVRVDMVGTESPPPQRVSFGNMVGESPAMQELFALLIRLSRSDLSVLIQGETGTGKEEAARALHHEGPRRKGPFVVLDATSLPEGLATSILFGHERGAFTGAMERRMGLFEAAHRGVLFIDEVGELSPPLQAMLLRVLQSREVTPLGTNKARTVDVRLICATWRDLRMMVNQGTFREDLYYRLAQATLWMPPLSERAEDVPLLVRRFLADTATIVPERAARDIAPDALAALQARTYRGNVRELRSVVDRLALLAEGQAITAADLQCEMVLSGLRARSEGGREITTRSPVQVAPNDTTSREEPQLFKEAKQTAIEAFERAFLVRLLERAGANLSRAAAFAGLERQNLRALLRKHGLYRTQ